MHEIVSMIRQAGISTQSGCCKHSITWKLLEDVYVEERSSCMNVLLVS